jgi:uncharacterized protein (DUF1015 family)
MAVVKPFRAQRYDPATAGPLESLVAPPYDVISPEQREELQARSPYNVVRLTLPDSEEAAAAAYRDWVERGILLEEQPTVWALAQEYVGPDGVARRREGLAASLAVEPYDRGTVLPHERTHARVKEGRLRLLRATRVQLEPIFLLYDGPPPTAAPEREPDLAVEGAQLWRLDDPWPVARAFDDKQLLIADGHHRYETAVAFHEEEGTPESAQMLVVLVSTEDPGLEIFPTHRVFSGPRELAGERAQVDDPIAALAALDGGRPAVVEVTRKGSAVLRGDPGLLDVQLVDTLGHEGIAYTPDAGEAVRLVRAGDAAVAYLMRPTRIEDVFAAARRGEVLPQKTTYFFPKLISGLLFHPLG